MKIRKIYFLAISALTLGLGACKEDSTEIDYSGYTDALVKTFSLADNSKVAPNLSAVYFTINQYGKVLPDNKLTGDALVGEIFNADSLPVGTVTSSLIAEIGFSDPKKVTLYTASDTTEYVATDSIDFSKPVLMEVLAGNGINKKFYEIRVNVHNLVPDSIHWMQLNPLTDAGTILSQKAVDMAGKAYWLIENASGTLLYTAPSDNLTAWTRSSANLTSGADLSTLCVFKNNLYLISNGALLQSADGVNWNVASAAMPFKNLIGQYGVSPNDSLIALVADGSGYKFMNSADAAVWVDRGNVPARFPLSGYSNPVQYAGGTSQRIVIMGGELANGNYTSSTWQYDGINPWQEFRQTVLPALTGASMVTYEQSPKTKDTFWMVLGGKKTDNTYSKAIYVSPNNKGVSWLEADTLFTFPTDFTARAFTSAYVDSNYFINLLGGVDNTGELNQIWRGRLNKLVFKPVE
ncbi:MAG: DUF6242 domain-containing protein [Bacteroidales bacterium]